MKQYDLPSGTQVTMVSPERVSEERNLEVDVIFFEADRIGPGHWGFRYVNEDKGEIGFALTGGWDSASHGVLVVNMDGGKE